MTPAERERLAKLCGMLGSDQVGERAAAALKVEQFRRAHNLTWQQILSLAPANSASHYTARDVSSAYERGYKDAREQLEQEQQRKAKAASAQQQASPNIAMYMEQCKACLQYYKRMSAWEQSFLSSIVDWLSNGIELTPKQAGKLQQLYNRTRNYSFTQGV